MTERERLIELLRQSGASFEFSLPEEIADYLLANGVIVPPVAVGQTVYVLDDFVWVCDCGKCKHFLEGWYDDPNECAKTKSCRKAPECTEIKEEVVSKDRILQFLHYGDIGKTVFLTREEAEKALERSRG